MRHCLPIVPLLLAALLGPLTISPAIADSHVDADPAPAALEDAANETEDARVMLERLAYIQGVIDKRLADRSALGERIEAANEQDQNDLRRQADDLTDEIRELRTTLGTLATGGVDSSLFVDAPVEEEGDWREDVALIARPVIDSLKELTEKPRRIAALNDIIAERQREFDTAERALAGLAPELALAPEGSLGKTLDALERTWRKRRDDARDAIERDVEQGAIAEQLHELLRSRGARLRPQPRPGATGEDDGGDVFHDGGSSLGAGSVAHVMDRRMDRRRASVRRTQATRRRGMVRFCSSTRDTR